MEDEYHTSQCTPYGPHLGQFLLYRVQWSQVPPIKLAEPVVHQLRGGFSTISIGQNLDSLHCTYYTVVMQHTSRCWEINLQSPISSATTSSHCEDPSKSCATVLAVCNAYQRLAIPYPAGHYMFVTREPSRSSAPFLAKPNAVETRLHIVLLYSSSTNAAQTRCKVSSPKTSFTMYSCLLALLVAQHLATSCQIWCIN